MRISLGRATMAAGASLASHPVSGSIGAAHSPLRSARREIAWVSRRATAAIIPGGARAYHGDMEAARLLRTHIDTLARTIGERNLWKHAALEDAAAYISGVLQAHGYRVSRQSYDVHRIRVSN